MGRTVSADTGQEAAQVESLCWEALGRNAPAAAFGRSLRDLLLRPADFFRRMALDGGLHEPLTFFAICLGALLVLAFPASLAYFALTAPPPGTVPVEVYQWHTLPPRVTGLMLVLLPLVLVLAQAAMVAVGSVVRLPGRLFGVSPWEGTVSVWLYAASAALAPLVAATAALLVVALGGWLVSATLPETGAGPVAAARWCARVLLPLGMLVGLAELARNVIVGWREALAPDPTVALSAALAGLLFLALLLAGATVAFHLGGFRGGVIALGAVALVMVLITMLSFAKARRTQGSI